MFEKTTMQLALLASLLFVGIQGSPVFESEGSEEIAVATIRGPRISPSEWINFNHNWSFPSFPSVTSLFYDDEKNENGPIHVRRRIDSLERTQKSIIDMLRKITQDVNALSVACADKKPDDLLPLKEQEKPILPDKPAINKDEIATAIQNASISAEEPEEQLPEKNEYPEVTEEPNKIDESEPSPVAQENADSNLPSDENNSNINDSDAQEIPEKIVIASTTLEENPGENPFGSISLVGFAPPHETRLNTRMSWNKDNKSPNKASK